MAKDVPTAVFLGAWPRAEPLLRRAADQSSWKAVFLSGDPDPKETAQALAQADLVLVLNVEPVAAQHLLPVLSAARAQRPELPIYSLDQRDSQRGFLKAGLLKEDAGIRGYWRNAGLENYRRMYDYFRFDLLGEPGEARPPVEVPGTGVWHPDAKEVFASMEDYLRWYEKEEELPEGVQRAAIVTQQSFILLEDTAVHAAVVRDLEARGIPVAVLYADDQDNLLAMLRKWHPDILLDDGHASPMLLKGATELDVPQIKMISLLRSTLEEWRKSPLGMEPGDVSLHLLSQEVYGIIDPQIVGGLIVNLQGWRMHEADPERVAHLGRRVEGWLRLRRLRPEQHRTAIVYYNKYLGAGDILRGSPSGAFLDGPASLFAVLRAMRSAGWKIDPFPEDPEQLLDWMRIRGRNIGSWASGDLARLVRKGDPVLIPVDQYMTWFSALPAKVQEEVIRVHGPAPGSQMVWHENGKDYLVIPRLDLGGVVLLPQPARGPENDERLLHARDVPPPHQYLAAYFWLQHQAEVDSLVHFGTHGSELLLPLRGTGLGPDDYGDICIGDLPAITPWVLDNVAEATLARRRAYEVLVDHMTPPYEGAGLDPALRELSRSLEQFQTLEPGIMRERLRTQIAEQAAKAAFPVPESGKMSDSRVTELATEIHDIRERAAPMSLHVLAKAPEPRRLLGMVASMLGHEFRDAMGGREKAETLLRGALVEGRDADRRALGSWAEKAAEYQRRLLNCGGEIRELLHALSGGFVPPGPGNDPVRNPAAVPTGRNMYALNPEEIPTRSAWEVGVTLARALLKQRPDLKKIAFDLNAFETMRDYGVMEGEIIDLLGLRPVWDENGLVVDVEVVPREQLEHPRIDVFIAISGTMRDNFPSRVRLLDRAIRLASSQKEADNRLRAGTRDREQELLAAGFSPERAAALAPARIFGQRPGQYGTRILYLIPKSGSWKSEEEVSKVYMENMAYVFTGDLWGKKVEGLYEGAVRGSEIVLRNWASDMMSPLSNHHVYEYAGGLSLALAKVNGKVPDLLLNDVRSDQPRLRDFGSVMREEFHSTLLNPKWMKGMKEHGYAGAGQMAELVKNGFGWQVTRPGAVEQAVWDAIHAAYVEDSNHLGLKEWFSQVNPSAFQEIAATLLEAHRKGYWKATKEQLSVLAKAWAESVAKDGYSPGLVGGGNRPLLETVRRLLGGPANSGLLAAVDAAVARVEKPIQGEQLEGMELKEEVDDSQQKEVESPRNEEKESTPNVERDSSPSWEGILAVLLLLAVFLAGWKRQGGAFLG